MTTVLGIDIGVGGALAILEDGELVDAVDMPVLCDGPAKRRSISAPLWPRSSPSRTATDAFVEHVGHEAMTRFSYLELFAGAELVRARSGRRLELLLRQ